MSLSIGELTKEKFHNFVEYCVNEIGVPEAEANNLREAERQSATVLLTAIKEHISPHIESVRERRTEVLQQTFKMSHKMTAAQVERVCLDMELFHKLASQMR